MRKFLIAAGAIAMSAAALPAVAAPAANQDSAQPGAQSGQAGQQARGRDPNQRVCVQDRFTGSRIRRRICRTQAEWEQLQENDASTMR